MKQNDDAITSHLNFLQESLSDFKDKEPDFFRKTVSDLNNNHKVNARSYKTLYSRKDAPKSVKARVLRSQKSEVQGGDLKSQTSSRLISKREITREEPISNVKRPFDIYSSDNSEDLEESYTSQKIQTKKELSTDTRSRTKDLLPRNQFLRSGETAYSEEKKKEDSKRELKVQDIKTKESSQKEIKDHQPSLQTLKDIIPFDDESDNDQSKNLENENVVPILKPKNTKGAFPKKIVRIFDQQMFKSEQSGFYKAKEQQKEEEDSIHDEVEVEVEEEFKEEESIHDEIEEEVKEESIQDEVEVKIEEEVKEGSVHEEKSVAKESIKQSKGNLRSLLRSSQASRKSKKRVLIRNRPKKSNGSVSEVVVTNLSEGSSYQGNIINFARDDFSSKRSGKNRVNSTTNGDKVNPHNFSLIRKKKRDKSSQRKIQKMTKEIFSEKRPVKLRKPQLRAIKNQNWNEKHSKSYADPQSRNTSAEKPQKHHKSFQSSVEKNPDELIQNHFDKLRRKRQRSNSISSSKSSRGGRKDGTIKIMRRDSNKTKKPYKNKSVEESQIELKSILKNNSENSQKDINNSRRNISIENSELSQVLSKKKPFLRPETMSSINGSFTQKKRSSIDKNRFKPVLQSYKEEAEDQEYEKSGRIIPEKDRRYRDDNSDDRDGDNGSEGSIIRETKDNKKGEEDRTQEDFCTIHNSSSQGFILKKDEQSRNPQLQYESLIEDAESNNNSMFGALNDKKGGSPSQKQSARDLNKISQRLRKSNEKIKNRIVNDQIRRGNDAKNNKKDDRRSSDFSTLPSPSYKDSRLLHNSSKFTLPSSCLKPSHALKPIRNLNEPTIPSFSMNLLPRDAPGSTNNHHRELMKRPISLKEGRPAAQNNRVSKEFYSQPSSNINHHPSSSKESYTSKASFIQQEVEIIQEHSNHPFITNNGTGLSNHDKKLHQAMRRLEQSFSRFVDSSDRNPDKKHFKKIIVDFFLEHSPFFRCLSRDMISYLLDLGKIVFYEPTATICFSNDICKNTKIVLYGVITIQLNDKTLSSTHGSCIGEEAILKPNRTSVHQFEARAITKSCMLVLGGQQIQELKLWSDLKKKKNEYILLLSQVNKQHRKKLG